MITPHAYTEDQLVEQPAIGLFAELGWQTVSAVEETFGAVGALLLAPELRVIVCRWLRRGIPATSSPSRRSFAASESLADSPARR